MTDREPGTPDPLDEPLVFDSVAAEASDDPLADVDGPSVLDTDFDDMLLED